MEFLYYMKLQVNILHATKTESIYQWTDSVFYACYKNQVDIYNVQKFIWFLLKSYKNRISFYGCYKNQVDLASKLQKPSWFLASSNVNQVGF